jgi:hypothetical protein
VHTEDVSVEVISDNSVDSAKASVTYSKVVDGSVVVVDKTFKGTQQEVEDAVDKFLKEK